MKTPPMSTFAKTAEGRRLAEDAAREKNWKRWGPYLSERQWGTVREDYSEHGNCWDYFSHDHARSRAYRWGEDGLLGITDREARLCFALALWNGRDPILKERLFGLTGPEGNHGEDVKEQYFYLDSTPTHSFMKALYKYPQREFPYAWLAQENRRRGRGEPEFELADTGAFDDGRYFDVLAEYAKAGPDDLLVRITVANRGPEDADLHLLPTLWFRNTWAWGCAHDGCEVKPRLALHEGGYVVASHGSLGRFELHADRPVEWLFTENETNSARVFGTPNAQPYVKDAFHRRVVEGDDDAVNPLQVGTKAAAWFRLRVRAGGEEVVTLRLRGTAGANTGTNTGTRTGASAGANVRSAPFGREFAATFDARHREADEFFARVLPERDAQAQQVARQGYAGLLWSKQFYHYAIREWIDGDPDQPAPPASRRHGRNHDWPHLFNRDVISMPDKWEYPWYAVWDLAFHMLPFARIDPHFAKEQLVLFLREWYMHPNGQIPAYEFAFGDVNPPVHAWACWRVYKMTGPRGQRDRAFLARTFQKLVLNFTWWVNRKDHDGHNLFSGGFLGLDNIGVFDRSQALPTGGHLEQADGTAWMAFFCATMLAMALELAQDGDPAYEDMASKFFEHFVAIADAMNTLGGHGLWDEQDGFYYDRLHVDGQSIPLKVRSLVGLMPLITALALEDHDLERLPAFRKRMEWFLRHRPDLARHISYMTPEHEGDAGASSDAAGTAEHHAHRLLAIPSKERLVRVLRYMLDESEFLSPYGIRSVSAYHREHPYVFHVDGQDHAVSYQPGESESWLFGGNSNWRGPIWFPINFLLVEALERFDHFYGDELKVECPTGSGRFMTLGEVAEELGRRLSSIFLPDASGRRPCFGDDPRFAHDPAWKDLVQFHEYFHGDTGRGLGASHQTGWTALVTQLLATRGRDGHEDAALRESHRLLGDRHALAVPTDVTVAEKMVTVTTVLGDGHDARVV